MGIIDKIRPNSQPQEIPSTQLSQQEIEVLLSMIRRTTFLGEDLEPLYNLVVK